MSPGSHNFSSIEQNLKPNILKLKSYKNITSYNKFYFEPIKISIMFSINYVASKKINNIALKNSRLLF